MIEKQTYVFFSSLTAAVHFSMALLYVVSMFLIFLSDKLRFYAALFLAVTWIQHKLFKGCSFTHLEGYFLKKAGKNTNDVFFFNRFAHDFFKKTFNMSVSRVTILFQAMILVFFIISMVIIFLSLF